MVDGEESYFISEEAGLLSGLIKSMIEEEKSDDSDSISISRDKFISAEPFEALLEYLQRKARGDDVSTFLENKYPTVSQSDNDSAERQTVIAIGQIAHYLEC